MSNASTAKPSISKVYRKKLPIAIIKKLFTLSGNQCAMPSCRVKLVYTGVNEIKGIVCHIEAASEGGPRYNLIQSELERHDYNNLIILCPNCHADVDKDPEKYPVDYLQRIKKEHESRLITNQYEVPENMIKIWKVSVNQDEFTLNKVNSLFAIYHKINDNDKKKYFYDNRLSYTLKNISLRTLEEDPTTRLELDEIFRLVSELPPDDFIDAFLNLKVNVPAHIFNQYAERYRDQLKNLYKTEAELASQIYWVIHKKNKEALSELIRTAAEFNPNAFEDIIKDFDYTLVDESTKFEIEGQLWEQMDKEEDTNCDLYKNLLCLDLIIFNSLQLNAE